MGRGGGGGGGGRGRRGRRGKGGWRGRRGRRGRTGRILNNFKLKPVTDWKLRICWVNTGVGDLNIDYAEIQNQFLLIQT